MCKVSEVFRNTSGIKILMTNPILCSNSHPKLKRAPFEKRKNVTAILSVSTLDTTSERRSKIVVEWSGVAVCLPKSSFKIKR